MYIKITRSGAQRYVQLAVSQRMEGHPRTKVLATLGRVDMLKARDVNSVINGLLRATGREALTSEMLRSLEPIVKKTAKKVAKKV